MSNNQFDLKHGLKVGDDTLKNVVMKASLTAGEIVEASKAAEQLVMCGEGENKVPMFVLSPTLMSIESLRRQIASIGDLQGPISMHQISQLHEDDLKLLNEFASKLEAIKVSQELAQRGRSDTAT